MNVNRRLHSVAVAIIAVLYSGTLPATTVNKGQKLTINTTTAYHYMAPGHQTGSGLMTENSSEISTSYLNAGKGSATGITDVTGDGMPYPEDDSATGIVDDIDGGIRLLTS